MSELCSWTDIRQEPEHYPPPIAFNPWDHLAKLPDPPDYDVEPMPMSVMMERIIFAIRLFPKSFDRILSGRPDGGEFGHSAIREATTDLEYLFIMVGALDKIEAIIPSSRGSSYTKYIAELYYGVPFCIIDLEMIVAELEKLKHYSIYELTRHISERIAKSI